MASHSTTAGAGTQGSRTRTQRRPDPAWTEQMQARLATCRTVNRTQPQKSYAIAAEVAQEAELRGDPTMLARAMVFMADACRFLDRRDDLAPIYARVEELLAEVADPDDRQYLFWCLGSHHIRQNNLAKGMAFLQQVEDIAGERKPTRDLAAAYNTMTIGFIRTGALEEALRYGLRSIELYNSLGSRNPETFVNIGAIYFNLREYPRALEYYHNALECARELGIVETVMVCLLNIGSTLDELGECDTALRYLHEALERSTALGHHDFIGEILLLLGNMHRRRGEHALALEYLEQIRGRTQPYEDRTIRAQALMYIGCIYQHEGRSEEALDLHKQAAAIFEEENVPEKTLEAYNSSVEIFVAMGDYHTAFRYQSKMIALREAIAGTERRRAMAAVEIRHAMENARRDRQLLVLRTEQAEREAEMKNRQLNEMALQLTRRNEAFKTLRDIAASYARNGRGQVRTLASSVLQNISTAVEARSQWNMIEEQFEQVHHHFIHNLLERCPGLTPTEIQICILIKLNLSSKQIADTLFSSPLTIKTHRNNIRRKLKLSGTENLTSLLLGM